MFRKCILLIAGTFLTQSVIADVPEVPKGIQNGKGYRQYLNYQRQKNHKAFAVSEQGATSWVAKRETKEQASEEALKSCNKMPYGSCVIIDTNGEVPNGFHQPKGFLQKTTRPKDGFQYFPSDIRDTDTAQRYKTYLNRPGNKAFAVSTSGASGWVVETTDLEDAIKLAMENCQKRNREKSKPCIVVDTNGEILAAKLKFSDTTLGKQAIYPVLPTELQTTFDEKTYTKYKRLHGHKAVATTPEGRLYYTYKHTTAEFAKRETLDHCEKRSQTKCQLIMVDNNIVTSENAKQVKAATKPWHGRYEVDLSNEPEIASNPLLKSMMPIFVLSPDQLQIELGGDVGKAVAYEVNGKKLTFKSKQKTVTGVFGDNYEFFILDSESKPKYIKVDQRETN